MNALSQSLSNDDRPGAGLSVLLSSFIIVLLLTSTTAFAATQLLLSRDDGAEHSGEYKGVVELIADPGFDNAKVTILVDGTKVAADLLTPYRVVADLGPTAFQHKITIKAVGAHGKRVQWNEVINRGMLPLTLKVKAVDLSTRTFEAVTTSPKDDPITAVELWDGGQVIASVTEAPYRFVVPEANFASGYVQVTAKTKSGEEAADFWSAAGDVMVEQVQVRTVPIFVSVVDRNGETRTDVDRTLFRILDNNNEAKIIEFGKAFDQPISISLLLDASASMLYELQNATKAANEFVEHALKQGDRCSVTAVQDVPRRRQPLTSDREAVAKALQEMKPQGRTALYDAINSAIRELRDEKNRRAIVVLTDGTDTSSNMMFDDIVKTARQAGIPLYFIAYSGEEAADAKQIDRLKYLAGETGGFVATATQQNLRARYDDIQRDLRGQYAILYQVTDYARSNEWRNVQVKLASPKLEARTIKGYFTP